MAMPPSKYGNGDEFMGVDGGGGGVKECNFHLWDTCKYAGSVMNATFIYRLLTSKLT